MQLFRTPRRADGGLACFTRSKDLNCAITGVGELALRGPADNPFSYEEAGEDRGEVLRRTTSPTRREGSCWRNERLGAA